MIVVGGLLVHPDGKRCLMGHRPAGKLRPLMWEYPGGKLDPLELAEVALRREWHEELAISVEVGMRIGSVSWVAEVPISWTLYHVRAPSSMVDLPAPLEHLELRWVEPLEAVKHLPCTPTTYLVYPAVQKFLDTGIGGSAPLELVPAG